MSREKGKLRDGINDDETSEGKAMHIAVDRPGLPEAADRLGIPEAVDVWLVDGVDQQLPGNFWVAVVQR
jgi:hypothetical protein